MNSFDMTNIFVVDLENLKKCFEVIKQKNQQSQQMIMEAQKYIEECKKDPQFPEILLTIFDDENESLEMRLLAIIEFKILIKEKWTVKKGTKTIAVYSDHFKNEIRAKLLTFLDKYQTSLFRKQIDDILRIISITDFPNHYIDLVKYFLGNMQELKKVIQDDQLLLSDLTLNFIKTLKVIMCEKTRKKIGDSRTNFYTIYLKLMEEFDVFWSFLHVNAQRIITSASSDNLDSIQRFIKLCRESDKIYIAFLCNGCEEMVENQEIVQIVTNLVQKAFELTETARSLKQNKDYYAICEQYNKNLYKYILSLSDLQAIFQWLFKDSLNSYLQILEFVIQNPEYFVDEYVLRAAVIGLNTVLRRYSYQPEDISVNKKIPFTNFEEVRQQCLQELQQFFTTEKIENFFNTFLLKLLPQRPFLTINQDPNNLDELVEIENDPLAPEFEKIETPLYNLTLKCTQEFLQRFPEQSIPLIHSITLKVIQNQIQDLSPLIQDGIFAMVGLLPTVYQQINFDSSNYLDLSSVLKYLEEKASFDLNLSKRIPVLIHKWIGLFDLNAKVQIVQNVVQITESLQNYVVRYECCVCLKIILQNENQLDLNYAVLSEHLVPIIVDLLGRFRNPQVIWGLIELLKILFMKAQYTMQNDNILAQLQNQNFLALTKLDDGLLLPALADTLKTVIASFPFGTPLTPMFQICIEFIDYHFKENRLRPDLVRLWLFIIREYHEVQQVGGAMEMLFERYSGAFLNIGNPEELSKFINIIEEYVLAQLIPSEGFMNIITIMEEKYNLAFSVPVPNEGIINLKCSLLSLMSTLLLTMAKQGPLENLKVFEKMLIFLLRELMSDFYDAEFKSLKPFKVAMTTLLNRFIILCLESFLEMIDSTERFWLVLTHSIGFQIGLYNFVGLWVNNMSFLISGPVRRLNALAVFHLLPHIKDRDILDQTLDDFLKATIPEVRLALENGGKPPVTNDTPSLATTERCDDLRDSERKKAIKAEGLYYDVNTKDLFARSFKAVIVNNNLTIEDLKMSIRDEDFLEYLLDILNNYDFNQQAWI